LRHGDSEQAGKMPDIKRQRILIVSGPIGVGKSSFVAELIERFSFRKLSSGAYLKTGAEQHGRATARLNLVQLGDQLDEETDYRWVVDRVAAPTIQSNPDHERWIFDSVRKFKQVFHFKSEFPGCVCHLHLVAKEQMLKDRYLSRNRENDIGTSYDEAIDTDNEREARRLEQIADIVIATDDRAVDEISRHAFEEYLAWSKSS